MPQKNSFTNLYQLFKIMWKIFNHIWIFFSPKHPSFNTSILIPERDHLTDLINGRTSPDRRYKSDRRTCPFYATCDTFSLFHSFSCELRWFHGTPDDLFNGSVERSILFQLSEKCREFLSEIGCWLAGRQGRGGGGKFEIKSRY